MSLNCTSVLCLSFASFPRKEFRMHAQRSLSTALRSMFLHAHNHNGIHYLRYTEPHFDLRAASCREPQIAITASVPPQRRPGFHSTWMID